MFDLKTLVCCYRELEVDMMQMCPYSSSVSLSSAISMSLGTLGTGTSVGTLGTATSVP